MLERAMDWTLRGLALALPLLLASYLAYERSLSDQSARASVLVELVLGRSEATNEQLFAAFQTLRDVPPAEACSNSSILTMRRIALSSPYLGGFGYIAGNALQCSSFGLQPDPVDVGAPDFVSATGYAVRRSRELDNVPGTRLLLASAPSGFTGFFHPGLLPRPVRDLSLGVVGYSTGITLMTSGSSTIKWREFSLAPGVFSLSAIRDGSLIEIRRSRKWDHFAYAEIPMTVVMAGFREKLPGYLLAGFIGAALCLAILQRLMAARASLQSLLCTAIRRNEIRVELQPIVEIATGRWVGAEALARWQHNGEPIPADVFIPLAEQHDLIASVTNAVVDRCFGELAPLLRAKKDFFVAVNCSSKELHDGALCDLLARKIVELGIAPGNVHVEITERHSVAAPPQLEQIRCLRSMGIQVGADDFGVGFSNLSYLDSLPLDYVKLDRSLLFDPLRDQSAGDIVATIAHLAQARGIPLIAEGVETADQRARLARCGVEYGQGWLFGRPMSTAEFVRRVRVADSAAAETAMAHPAPAVNAA
jgi:sensor c-di-GMP phosphodiesterase-like protein